MFKFICDLTNSPHLRANFPFNNLLSRLLSSSTTLNSPFISSNQKSFTVKYLINSCGFTPESAISASKSLILKTPERPDSVLALFKNHGFTKTQIVSIVKRYPRILLCNSQKTLLPKFEFFTSIGFARSELVRVVTAAPNVLRYSMEDKIIPSYSFFRDLLQSDEKTNRMIRNFPYLLTYDLKVYVVRNIQILRDAGVPEQYIIFYVTYRPSGLRSTSDNFRKAVEEVIKRRFNPLTSTFIRAFIALRSMSTSTMEKKVGLFKRWGWSESEVHGVFRKSPLTLTVSEDKITRVMDFFINKMHAKHSLLVNNPKIFSMSLERTIIPRCWLYQVLLGKGLIKEDTSAILGWLVLSEKNFISRVRLNYKEEAPQLLKLYQAKLKSAKMTDESSLALPLFVSGQ